MKSIWIAGMFSGLLSGVLVAFISVFTISASIDTNDIELPDLRGAEHFFEAPFSGDAILIGEAESTGCFLWGSILIVRESLRESYALNTKVRRPVSCRYGPYTRDPVTSVGKQFRDPQLINTNDGSLLTKSEIEEDENILCHVANVGQETDDSVRPARISFNCPLMELRRGERYLISVYMEDRGGTVDRFDAAIRYIYRRPRIW